MDKFDDYLEKKSECEDKEFILPKAFEDKLKNTLDNLDSEPQKNNYRKKKIIASAAGIIFVCLIGWKLANNNMFGNSMNSRTLENSVTNETADYDSGAAKSYMTDQRDNYGADEYSIVEKTVDENTTSKIIFKNLIGYKVVEKTEDISEIANLINNNSLIEINEVELDNWQYLIETVGEKNHIIMIKNNIMNVDDRWFEINEDVSKEFGSLYYKLDYSEKDINSCDF